MCINKATQFILTDVTRDASTGDVIYCPDTNTVHKNGYHG